MSHLDWANLVASGQAKALGVSWSDEELVAKHTHKIPVEFIRAGITTPEAYEKAKQEVAHSLETTKKKPVKYMSKPELLEEAKSVGAQTSPDMTRGDLILVINESLSTNSPTVGRAEQASSGVDTASE